jgi:hypothetical protein
MSAADAVALGTALEAAAAAVTQPLPASIARKLQRLTDARRQLSDIMRRRIQAAGDADSPSATVADNVLDGVWGGLREQCRSYLRLPRNDETAALMDAAQALLQALYPDGLAFTGLRFHLQWVESQSRIEMIDTQGLIQHFNTLPGGRIFLTQLRAAHAAYGEALGLTRSAPQPNVTMIRTALNAFQSGLRRYVMAVNGNADPDVPGSEELAVTLLRPLDTWKPTPAKASADKAPDDGDSDGTPGEAPDDGGDPDDVPAEAPDGDGDSEAPGDDAE